MKKIFLIVIAIFSLGGCTTLSNVKDDTNANYQTALQNIDGIKELLNKEHNLINAKVKEGYVPSMKESQYAIKTIFGGYEQLATSNVDFSEESINYMIQASVLLQVCDDSKLSNLGKNAENFIITLNDDSYNKKEKADSVLNLYESLTGFVDLTEVEPTLPEMFGI